MPEYPPVPFDREDDELVKQLPERFAVTDDASANWVVKRIIEARAYSRRVTEWANLELRRARREEAFFLKRFGPELDAWLTKKLAETQSRQKSVNLPAGRVGRRAVREKLSIYDEDALLAWAQSNLPEAVETTEKVRKSTINDLFFGTGELPPGVGIDPSHEALVIH